MRSSHALRFPPGRPRPPGTRADDGTRGPPVGMTRPQLGLTARGSALMTAGLTALVCGYVLGQRDLVRVALLLAGAPIIASIFLTRSRISIASQRSAEPNRVPAGVA